MTGPADPVPSDAEILQRLTAVVPVRDGEALLPGCLEALRRNGVRHVVVVDGRSSDRSRAIAVEHGAEVVSDDGRGLPYARTLGARTAATELVVLVDVDVVFPDGAVAALVREFLAGRYAALQAGQESIGGPGYWGRALAHHHRTGLSRNWFGLVATVFHREELLAVGFDDDFRSGEDIELRWRLRALGRPAAVSRAVMVQHRFAGDDFAFAKDQFLMDGAGLGLMVRRNGLRGLRLAFLPAAAAARGVLLSSVRGEGRWIRYYGAFAWWNYVGMARGVRP
jgi:glycosyltransferase involved in cell wall biosynthesis